MSNLHKAILAVIATAATVSMASAQADTNEQTNEEKFIDFTQPTFAAPVDKAEDYVDMQGVNRTVCRDRPHRPGWLMVHPRSLAWRQQIASMYRSSIVTNRVVDGGFCTCELAYPDYEELRPEIEAIWAQFDNMPKGEWSKARQEEYSKYRRALRRTYSSKLGKYGALCASLK